MQQIVFEDAAGNPLMPLSITDGETISCSTPLASCTGNALTYDMRDIEAHPISAEATTGERFNGSISPVKLSQTLATCGCSSISLKPLTIWLTAP